MVGELQARGPWVTGGYHNLPCNPEKVTADGWLRIIGVVGSVRHSSLEETPQPEIYISHLQGPPVGPFMAMRTTGDPALLASGLRTTLKEMGVLQVAPRLKAAA